ncbi:hypothetical protein [Spirochaeta cellobiosiphila]|uniref:hypothetical protein n=1 Tax=Spirochaeta cellobiosiphila TaxID=504483 RepID=UPI00048B2E56|nr:hypothetical protein [Spirochaeta cellobiosiphila]
MESANTKIYIIRSKSQSSDSKFIEIISDHEWEQDKYLHLFSGKIISIKSKEGKTASIKGIAFKDLRVDDLLIPYDDSVNFSSKFYGIKVNQFKSASTDRLTLKKWNSMDHPYWGSVSVNIDSTPKKVDKNRIMTLSLRKKIALAPGYNVELSDGSVYYILAPLDLAATNLNRFAQFLSNHRGITIYSLYFALYKINRVVAIPQGEDQIVFPHTLKYGCYIWEEDYHKGCLSKLIKFCRYLGGRNKKEILERLGLQDNYVNNLLSYGIEKELLKVNNIGHYIVANEEESSLLSPLGSSILQKIKDSGLKGIMIQEDRNPLHAHIYEQLMTSDLISTLGKEYLLDKVVVQNLIDELRQKVGDQELTLDHIKEQTDWGRKKSFALLEYLYSEGYVDCLEEGRRFV